MRRCIALWFVVAALFAACPFPLAADEPAGATQTSPSPRAEHLEIVLIGNETLWRVEIAVFVDGEPVARRWDEAFDWLLAVCDRDDNGTLSQQEAARLPSSYALRQLLWQYYSPRSGRAPAWSELDLDGNGKTSRDELADYYRRQGLGGALVGLGRPPLTAMLGESLCKWWDLDGNSSLEAREGAAAGDLLAKLDTNGDELIGPGELVANAIYPGATGTLLLTAAAPSSDDDRPQTRLVVLPQRILDYGWTTVLVQLRDRDGNGALDAAEAGIGSERFGKLDRDANGSLSADELAGWRMLPADIRWTLRFGEPSQEKEEHAACDPKQLAIEGPGVTFELHLTDGKMAAATAEARKRFVEEFAEADTNHDHFVVEGEIGNPRVDRMKQLRTDADRDSDGRLAEQELLSWLDFCEHVAQSHVLVTVLDFGPGLFELLDVNHDGALSQRELRQAWSRLQAEHCIVDDRLDMTRLPYQLWGVVSRGQPQSVVAPSEANADGPKWFEAMDRNGDGDVSRREFLGAVDEFRRLDADADGLLSSTEATAVNLPTAEAGP